MILASYVPDLTPEEAERFWMTPVEVCRLAAVGEADDPGIKKMLNTLSDRGHVPFVKSGTAKTSPRLYSLVSAAMLRTIAEIIEDGRTYRYAESVAQEVGRKLVWAAQEMPDLGDFDLAHSNDRILFSGMTNDGTPRAVRWITGDSIPHAANGFSYSLFDAGYLIFRVCMSYPDFWADDLDKRGIQRNEPPGIGYDAKGFPIWPDDEGAD